MTPDMSTEPRDPSRTRLYAALGKLQDTADALAEAALQLQHDGTTEEDKLLRDFYARAYMSLHDSLQELRVLAARRR